jgi:hypothetical protein
MFKKMVVLISVAFILTACNSTKVPSVVGQEASYAQGILKGQDFEVEVTEKVEDGVKPGQVLSQEPSAQTSVNKGSKVKLIVAKSPTYQIKGSLRLVDSKIAGSDDYCYGTGGYKDIQGGMSVTIRDGKGGILATGNTESGKRPTGEFSNVQCVFSFQLDNVPKSDFYSVEVGRRGQLNFSYEEMKSKNWEVDFSLG